MFGMTSFNAQEMIAADADGDQGDEVIADFGVAGVWACDLGSWARWTSADPNTMVSADVNNDGRDDCAFGLAGFGTWLWNDGVWLQLSGLLPKVWLPGTVQVEWSRLWETTAQLAFGYWMGAIGFN